MKAIINHSLPGEHPQVVETVDITHCMLCIKQLKELADIIWKNPEAYCDAAKIMSGIIRDIENGIVKEY